MLVNEGLLWEALEDQRKVMDANLDVTMILLASLRVMGVGSAFKLETQGNVTESRGKVQSWACPLIWHFCFGVFVVIFPLIFLPAALGPGV